MNLLDGFETVQRAAARALEPDLATTVDEWSDRYMVIPRASGSNEYGQYRTSRTPHARAVMLALSDSHPCKRVVAMCASQMFKTQVALNWLCSTIYQSPSNFLWLMPTGKLHKRIAGRIDKTFAAVPVIQERVAQPHSRDAANNLDTKEYIGGTLFIATAGAAANLSEVPARRVAFDEVDRADANVNGEGDPVKLAEARQTTFDRNRKAYYYSSPTIDGESKIQALYQEGTQREALADCIHCGHAQPLVFERLVPSDDGAEALYPCETCGGIMREADKPRMFARGAWSEAAAGDGETESFSISAMFLPYGWFSWIGLMREHAAAKQQLEEGSEEAMITFYNTRLARVWARAKEQTKHDELMARADSFRQGTVPAGGLQLTMAVDVQGDRLEAKVVAWGPGMECWIVDYQVILSSPAEEATWRKLDDLVAAKYRHASGIDLGIQVTFVDSGGTATQEVYTYTAARRSRRVYAIKGNSVPNRPILPAKPSHVDYTRRGEIIKKGVQLWHIGTDTAKHYLARRWKYTSGPGAVHFPADLEEDYYRQLTSEYLSTKYRNGMKVVFWEKKQQDRNEALDLMVYNLAAAHQLGLHRLKPPHWEKLAARILPPPEAAAETPPETAPSEPEADTPVPEARKEESFMSRARPAKRSGFVRGWKRC